MKAITFQDNKKIQYTDIPEPSIIDQGDVIVKTTSTSICGSDLHVYHGREKGIDTGTVMGHEFTGKVVETGSTVKSFKTGDHVVSPFTINCGACYFCKVGLTARCEKSQLFGWVAKGKGLQGAQAEYVRVPMADSTLVKIPDHIQTKYALLAGDILSTGYFCAEMAEVKKEHSYVILGCGPVGLLAILGAFELGANKVYAIDSAGYRLDVAKKLGAIPVRLENNTPEMIAELTHGIGFDSVLEAVGSPEAQMLAYEIVRPGGIIATVGVHTSSNFSFSPVDAYNKNITFKIGRCSARHYMEILMPKIEKWTNELNRVITHELPLNKGVDAYHIFDQKLDNCIKIILLP